MRLAIVLSTFFWLLPIRAADPKMPVFWSASQLNETEKTLPPKVNPERHLATERLMDSAFILYRVGPSEGEVHQSQGDMIIVRSGEGAVLVGGKLADARSGGPGELRGRIEGGTTYPMKTGDTLYVPANMPHRFLVDSGRHFSAYIIKITPKE